VNPWTLITRTGLAIHMRHPQHPNVTYCGFLSFREAAQYEKDRLLHCKNCVNSANKWNRW